MESKISETLKLVSSTQNALERAEEYVQEYIDILTESKEIILSKSKNIEDEAATAYFETINKTCKKARFVIENLSLVISGATVPLKEGD